MSSTTHAAGDVRRAAGKDNPSEQSEPPRGRVLVVEDGPLVRQRICSALEREGYEVHAAADEAQGRALIQQLQLDLVFMDLGLAEEADDLPVEERGGTRLFALLRRVAPSVPVVMITADTDAESAVTLLQQGAYHYLVKPVAKDRLLHVAEHGVELARARRLSESIGRVQGLEAPRWHVGHTPRMQQAQQLVELFAPTDAAILLQGETGTGKEVVARHLHQLSQRADGPFIPLNCAALPDELLESELFGHEKGAFTGAVVRKRGRLELADGGTLFLDELTSMAPKLQAKLLRALQEFRFMRVGGEREIKVDVRLISATNRDVHEAIDAGDFRPDLYYRICVQPIDLPPLRERPADVAPLATLFIDERRKRGGQSVTGLTENAAWTLSRYPWPGNVRELRNVVERAMVMASATGNEQIDVAHLPPDIVDGRPPGAPIGAAGRPAPEDGNPPPDLPANGLDLNAVRDAWEARLMRQALARTAGNQSAAARLLCLTRDMFRSRVDKYGLGDETLSGGGAAG